MDPLTRPLSRRAFLRVAGAAAFGAALGDALAPSAGPVLAAPAKQVAVKRAGAALYAGPGDVSFRQLGTLAKGQKVTPSGRFGDFVRVSVGSYRNVAGAIVRRTTGGYVLRSDLAPLPAGVPTLAVAKVPWLTRAFVAPSSPLVMPSVGTLLDGYKAYMLFDGTWYAERDLQIRVDAAFASHPGIPMTSASGLVLENVTATRDPDHTAQLTLLHNGADRGWYFGYNPGPDWEFFEKLPIAAATTRGRFTISVDGLGRSTSIVLPSGARQVYPMTRPLFRRGDVLSLSLSDSPFTDMTVDDLALSLAPDGRREADPAPYGSLRAHAAKAGITIGVATDSWRPGPDPRYEQVVTSQFDLLVPSGDFNWDWLLRPDATHYDFAGADLQARFAERHGMAMRAYLLPSGNAQGAAPADAPWLTPGKYSRSQLLDLVHDHIATVVGRYRGVVSEWLVLGETIFEGEFVPWNFWLNAIGPEFIDLVFRWAHEADPAASLLYEFTSDEWAEPQATGIYNHIADLRSRGIPVDNVGFEMHVFDATNPPTKDQLLADFRHLGTLGVGVEITEMDVNVYRVPGSLADKYAAQARIYGDALRALLESGVGRSFTTWGLVDSQSWLFVPSTVSEYGPAQAPLLFDDDYAPKPAYFALLDALTARS